MVKDNLRKGEKTRQSIITIARDLFNEQGVNIKLADLASGMDRNVSYITNHFPSKDHLFVAIAEEYSVKISMLTSGIDWTKEVTLAELAELYSVIMDLQYNYRCVIRAAAASSEHQTVLYTQIGHSYKKDKEMIRQLLSLLTQAGLLEERILDKHELKMFTFQYVTLFTNWVVSLEIYDKEYGYKKMKPVYLRGIVSLFLPFFTQKAKTQYLSLNWNKLN